MADPQTDNPFTQYVTPAQPKQEENPFAQYAAQPSVVTDIAKSALPAAERGINALMTTVPSMWDLAAKGLEYGAGKVLPESVSNAMAEARKVAEQSGKLHRYEDVQKSVEKVTGPLYHAQTTPGKFAERAIEFAPAALGGAGGLGPNLVKGTAAAVGSEAAGQATEGTAYEPYARVAGAVGGPSVLTAARRVATPFPVTNQQHIGDVKTLTNAGIPLSAARQTDSPLLRRVEGSLSESTGAPQRFTDQGEREGFTKALMQSTGSQSNTPRDIVTGPNGQPMRAAAARLKELNTGYENFFNTNKVSFPQTLNSDLQAIAGNYKKHLGVQAADSVDKSINDILLGVSGKAMPNASVAGMTGGRYQALKELIDGRIEGATTGLERQSLISVKNKLEEALQSSLSPSARSELQQLNQHYGNLKTITAAEWAPGGVLDPRDVANSATKRIGKEALNLGKGPEAGKVAEAAESVFQPRPKPSDWASAGIGSLFGSVTGALHDGLHGGLEGSIAGAISTPAIIRLLSNPATAKGYYSGPVQNYLANQKFKPGPATTMDPRLVASLLAQSPMREQLAGGK